MIHLRNFLGGILLMVSLTTAVWGQTNTNTPMWTCTKGPTWEETTVRLIVADSPKTDGKAFQEVKAKWATYKLNKAFTAKLELSTPYTSAPAELHIVMFRDPHSKKTVFISQGFYVSSPDGVTAYSPIFHSLYCSMSLLELAESKGEAADIAYFESVFDVEKAILEKIGPYERRVIFFRDDLPFGYFSDSSAPGGMSAGVELKNAEMTKGILRVDLWNPLRKIPASVWFDVKGKKVIRAVADGKEMEISDPVDWSQPNKRVVHPWSGVYFRNDHGGALPDAAVNDPITVTLLPNDNLMRWRRDGTRATYENPEQLEIKTTRLLRALWLSRKDQGMELAYIPVAWGRRKYLVAPNEMIDFCVAVNAGSEPRKTRFGSFLLREGDEKIALAGWPEIPVKYHPYLLKEPIVATITKAGKIPEDRPIDRLKSVEVILDKGRQAGVLEGMEFYYLPPTGFYLLPQTGYGKIKVKTVSDNSAEAVAEFYGENGIMPHSERKVSTRFQQPRTEPSSGEAEAQWELLDESEAQFQSPFFPAPRIKSR
ncbi:MAG TPA: hypothetical protein VGH19_17920 [Verrucomicrobiae bacterium]